MNIGGGRRKPRLRASKIFRELAFKLPHGSEVKCFEFDIKINDGPNFFVQYKDEFLRGIYRFDSARENPLIIDGGCNMGLSILAFKHFYPRARIIGFEPDPKIFALLKENVERNHLSDVRLINAGLGGKKGRLGFSPDAAAGGQLVAGRAEVEVDVVTLSEYLSEEVDFLKLNIEGLEWDVLREAADAGRLRNVREIVVEYHGWAKGPQKLGAILNLLDEQGFRYLVHDFDELTCLTSKPPFRLPESAPWFCLVYARRNP
jgi:FkbM family methyltransferase